MKRDMEALQREGYTKRKKIIRCEFEVGEKVLVYRPVLKDKFSTSWKEGFKIEEKLSQDANIVSRGLVAPGEHTCSLYCWKRDRNAAPLPTALRLLLIKCQSLCKLTINLFKQLLLYSKCFRLNTRIKPVTNRFQVSWKDLVSHRTGEIQSTTSCPLERSNLLDVCS